MNAVGYAVGMNAAAADAIVIQGIEQLVDIGESVAFPVSVENNSGICNAGIVLNYDPALTPVLDANGLLVYDLGDIAESRKSTVALAVNKEEHMISFTMAGSKNDTRNGMLFTVYFDIPEDAEPRTSYGVGVSAPLLSNEKCVNFTDVKAQGGSITVADLPELPEHRVSDSEKASLYFDTISGKAGEEVQIPIKIKHNIGFAGCGIRIKYDERLNPARGDKCIELGEAATGLNINGHLEKGECIISLQTYGDKEVTVDGTVFYLYLTLPKEAKTSDRYSLLMEMDYFENAAHENMMEYVTLTAGEVLVKGNLRGDVDCNQNVDISDAILLSRYVTEDKVEISEQGFVNADVTNDNIHTVDDVTLIIMIIAHLAE